ncbi:hypothetical protein M431DRAFT_416142 [Trichoderma harzianum CBS 226.95]|uniref:Secreted protein n=1 Tax=Trichoderma harzianum CBS 226.95 TaxID=983964 RepID=A0A2T4AG40_TRIHA|nr:hypothetical protein M431DRAFT_416142 [Trichoderma harzianum CBS 226.95]PTB56049.1 hypothetical protein M431DRAFT_416142 [Trichoderma harzianum CBS 226.95]
MFFSSSFLFSLLLFFSFSSLLFPFASYLGVDCSSLHMAFLLSFCFCEFTCKSSEILSSPSYFPPQKLSLHFYLSHVLTYCSISNVLGMCGILCISSYRSKGRALFSSFFFPFSFILQLGAKVRLS